jgi:cytochrome c553
MKRFRFALNALLFSAAVAAAEPPGETAEHVQRRMGSGNPVLGKAKSEAELCQGCHGETGDGAAVGVPKLNGQYASYIVKQLADFRSQKRRHRIMNAMAEGLSDADLPDIAAYFASRPRMKGAGPAANPAARDLFLYGDVDRNIDACVSCHDLDGTGRESAGTVYPAIGGQSKGYLKLQLLNWNTGTRANSPKGVMNRIAEALSEEEISALAEYISGLRGSAE